MSYIHEVVAGHQNAAEKIKTRKFFSFLAEIKQTANEVFGTNHSKISNYLVFGFPFFLGVVVLSPAALFLTLYYNVIYPKFFLDINEKDKDENTPIMLAATKLSEYYVNHTELLDVIDALLEQNVEIDHLNKNNLNLVLILTSVLPQVERSKTDYYTNLTRITNKAIAKTTNISAQSFISFLNKRKDSSIALSDDLYTKLLQKIDTRSITDKEKLQIYLASSLKINRQNRDLILKTLNINLHDFSLSEIVLHENLSVWQNHIKNFIQKEKDLALQKLFTPDQSKYDFASSAKELTEKTLALLKAGANPNTTDTTKRTILHNLVIISDHYLSSITAINPFNLSSLHNPSLGYINDRVIKFTQDVFKLIDIFIEYGVNLTAKDKENKQAFLYCHIHPLSHIPSDDLSIGKKLIANGSTQIESPESINQTHPNYIGFRFSHFQHHWLEVALTLGKSYADYVAEINKVNSFNTISKNPISEYIYNNKMVEAIPSNIISNLYCYDNKFARTSFLKNAMSAIIKNKQPLNALVEEIKADPMLIVISFFEEGKYYDFFQNSRIANICKNFISKKIIFDDLKQNLDIELKAILLARKTYLTEFVRAVKDGKDISDFTLTKDEFAKFKELGGALYQTYMELYGDQKPTATVTMNHPRIGQNR